MAARLGGMEGVRHHRPPPAVLAFNFVGDGLRDAADPYK